MTTSARAFILGVAAALAPVTSISEDTKPPGYVIESYTSSSIVTGGYGQCWHTSYWTPEARIEQCDPDSANAAQTPPAPATPAPQASAEPPKPAQDNAAAVTQPLPPDTTAATPLPPPQSEPAPVAPPPNPRLETALLPQTVHYSTDAFFDFDESTLRPEGRAALEDLVHQLSEVKYGSIRVVGHTDRIGGEEYNLELSERRANAVKNYLVRRNVPGDRVQAVGKGKSEPTVKTSDCNGPKSPRVVKCLQPDRRVDVEVAGTKDATTGSK